MAEFHIQIAQQTAAVRSLFESTRDYCRAYLTDQTADFSIATTQEDLLQEQQLLLEEAQREGFRPKNFPDPFLERAVILRKLSGHLLDYNTILLHGSAVAVNGLGYLFSAKCGTGKSTHVRYWRQLLGDDAVIINDDKPFFHITETQVLVCGSPWNGKHGLGTNITVPLKGICFLQRGSENRIRQLTAREAAPSLRANSCPPQDPDTHACYLMLLEALAERIAFWSMECTKDPLAAKVAYEAMSSFK